MYSADDWRTAGTETVRWGEAAVFLLLKRPMVLSSMTEQISHYLGRRISSGLLLVYKCGHWGFVLFVCVLNLTARYRTANRPFRPIRSWWKKTIVLATSVFLLTVLCAFSQYCAIIIGLIIMIMIIAMCVYYNRIETAIQRTIWTYIKLTHRTALYTAGHKTWSTAKHMLSLGRALNYKRYLP